MELKDIKLKKGMTKEEVNKMIDEFILLEDKIYNGTTVNNNWKCKECGNIFSRRWDSIRNFNQLDCGCIRRKNLVKAHKEEVEKIKGYKYIKSYFVGEILPSGKIAKYPCLKIKHEYCEEDYIVKAGNFISKGDRCGNCCQKYENSIAHHIEQILKLDINDVWDFNKNTSNPYHIGKGTHNKVWIKCINEEINEINGLMKRDYHESYEIRCDRYVSGSRCPCCNSRNIHPYDSFGYCHLDKVMSWHSDNKISPFRVALSSHKKYKFKCESEDCKHEWDSALANINNGNWCPKCASSKGEKRIAKYLLENNINFKPQKEYKGLFGLGGGSLSYDFHLIDHNILIEYQGEFHDGVAKMQTKGQLDAQREHDRRKREYAQKNNIELLEIWYWDFENIEGIINSILVFNGIKRIKNKY